MYFVWVVYTWRTGTKRNRVRAKGKHICFLSISLVSGIRNQLMRAYLFCYCASFSSHSPSAAIVGRSVGSFMSIPFACFAFINGERVHYHHYHRTVYAIVVVSSIAKKASEEDTKTWTQASYYNRYFTLRVYAHCVRVGEIKTCIYFVVSFHSVRSFIRS